MMEIRASGGQSLQRPPGGASVVIGLPLAGHDLFRHHVDLLSSVVRIEF